MPTSPSCSPRTSTPVTTSTAGAVPTVERQAPTHAGDEREGAQQDQPVISFSCGLPGFPDAHRFALASLGNDLEPFCRLVCKDQLGVEFVAVPPEGLFRDYKVRVDDDTAAELEITGPDSMLVLNIVTLPTPGHNDKPTINLLGPIIVNKQTLAARQVILHDTDYGVAEPLSA